ncbi:MAG: sirohydrochlorin cobaltochelatase [Victivallaceae bacterium]|nr:sirohydrochlorin cobaltochelatase [Victivallaceae bacterium]
MKEEILVVFIGSSHPQAEKSYSNIEAKVQAKRPEMKLRRAYTSKVSRDRLAKQGIQVDSVEEVLIKMAAGHVDHVSVLPCMIFSNSACMEMMADFMIHGEKFKDGISMFRVMLDLTADYEIFANAFFDAVIPPERHPDDAVVLMAHSASDQFSVLGMVLKQRDNNTFITTLEDLPELSTLREELKQAEIKKVYLIPLMMTAGIHVHRDMAETMCQAIEADNIKCIPITQGLGENNRIAQLLANHII